MKLIGYWSHLHECFYFRCCRRRMQITDAHADLIGIDRFYLKVANFRRYARSQARRTGQ
jgi:hypothetical protein